jgi:hypothetical protein
MESAQYWCIEMICAGHYMELWESFLLYMGRYIHLGNPKLIIYLETRYQIFCDIIHEGVFIHEIQLRNNPIIRRLFSEIVGVLIYSHKKPSIEFIKINRAEEFDITLMAEKLKATDTHFLDDIFQKEDPKEIFIPLNELAYHCSPHQINIMNACYWIEWLIEFDTLCKKRKEQCKCERRSFVIVENKYSKDMIWIIFDIFFWTLKRNGENPFLSRIMTAILKLFSIKYSSGIPKKRKYLLYMAVAFLCEPVPINIDIMGNKIYIQNALEKIDTLYKQIKKNECSPNIDYLFHNMEKDNEFKRSMMKMELVNSIDDAIKQ